MVGGSPSPGSEAHPWRAGLENSSLVTVVELWGAWSGGFQLAAGMRLYTRVALADHFFKVVWCGSRSYMRGQGKTLVSVCYHGTVLENAGY